MVAIQEPIGITACARIEKTRRYFKDRITVYSGGIIFLSLLFFFLYSVLVFSVYLPFARDTGHIIHDWPDAMANHAFVNALIETSQLSIENPQNVLAGGVIHPRSVKVINGNLVPVGFLGMPILYGALGKIVGARGVFFLTPIFAVLGVLFFYALIKKIFNQAVAFWSALLLFTLSAYWYYSTQIMLPNILFVSLLIAGLYFILNCTKLSFVQGAFLIGLALAVRTVEAPWVLLLLMALLIIYGRKRWLTRVILFIVFFGLAFAPVLYFNNQLYGEYFTVGYLKTNQELSILERVPSAFDIDATDSARVLSVAKALLLPFGFNGEIMLKNFFNYFAWPAMPYLVLAVVGFLWFLFNREKTRRQQIYAALAFIISVWLIFYYGNWLFEDKDVLNYNVISSSYARYWLPLYILPLPFVGYLFTRLSRGWRAHGLVVGALIMLGLASYSYLWVYKSPYDGLDKARQNFSVYFTRYQAVKSMIETESLLITDKTDKLFFPKYDVVVFLLDYTIFPRLKSLIGSRPIYYLTTMPDKDIEYINKKKIQELGLKFIEPKVVDQEYRLFRLDFIKGI